MESRVDLWVGAELFTFLALIPVFVQWVKFEERKSVRIDAQLDAESAARTVLPTSAAEG